MAIDTADALLERVRHQYRELPTLNVNFLKACACGDSNHAIAIVFWTG